MSVEKAEIRLAAVHDLGVRLEDILEAARFEVPRQEGAGAAFQMAVRVMVDKIAILDKEALEGGADLPGISLAKLYLQQALATLESMGKQASLRATLSSGKVQGLEIALQAAKRARDIEQAGVTQAAMSEPDRGLSRQPQGRPQPIKAARQALSVSRENGPMAGGKVPHKEATPTQRAAQQRVGTCRKR